MVKKIFAKCYIYFILFRFKNRTVLEFSCGGAPWLFYQYVLENAGNNIRILIYFINIKTVKMKGYDQNILVFGYIRNSVFKIELPNLFKRFFVYDRDVPDGYAVCHIINTAATASERDDEVFADIYNCG